MIGTGAAEGSGLAHYFMPRPSPEMKNGGGRGRVRGVCIAYAESMIICIVIIHRLLSRFALRLLLFLIPLMSCIRFSSPVLVIFGMGGGSKAYQYHR